MSNDAEKPPLTVAQLELSGFTRAGTWRCEETRLTATSQASLPKTAGVYAFSIGGVVQYVGVASKTLSQRLAFYGRPGPSQTTNIRLNELIRAAALSGHQVDIHFACPPSTRWNGLTISGAEGLEAGLIRDFALPWNIRGSVKLSKPKALSQSSKRPIGSTTSAVEELIRRRPGLTEAEIAAALYGKAGYQQKVNPACRELVSQRRVERRGRGRNGDPYTYHPRASAPLTPPTEG